MEQCKGPQFITRLAYGKQPNLLFRLLDKSGSGEGKVAAVCKQGNETYYNKNHQMHAVLLILI